MAKRSFFDGPLYTITNYIYWFALSNIYFMLLNFLFIFFLMTPPVDASQGYSSGYYVLLFIVSLPIGPTITALLSVMGKIIREKDVSVTREYFKSLKQSFKQSFLAWFIELLLIVIMLGDIKFFGTRSYGAFLIPIFYVFIIIILILGLYVFPIISRFYLKLSDVYKLAFYYAIKKFKVTLFNIFAIVASVFLMKMMPSIVIIFLGSIICYMIMLNEKDVLKELEDRITDASAASEGEDKADEENNIEE